MPPSTPVLDSGPEVPVFDTDSEHEEPVPSPEEIRTELDEKAAYATTILGFRNATEGSFRVDTSLFPYAGPWSLDQRTTEFLQSIA